MTPVPLPPGAWTGLGVLGALAVARCCAGAAGWRRARPNPPFACDAALLFGVRVAEGRRAGWIRPLFEPDREPQSNRGQSEGSRAAAVFALAFDDGPEGDGPRRLRAGAFEVGVIEAGAGLGGDKKNT